VDYRAVIRSVGRMALGEVCSQTLRGSKRAEARLSPKKRGSDG
jgi:hypothetical protein